VAPNVGILCLRIPVPDATRYAAEITARGGTLYSPPTSFELAPYGRATIFSVRSPEGAILEFFDAPFEQIGAG
jgi:predicted enzyme related to lactoylglutathione lyase